MQVAVIGSRAFSNYSFLYSQLSRFPISSIVSGGAAGADSLAARYAQECGLPLQVFLPDYGRYGRRAPLVRNQYIISSAQQVIAFWDGRSSGTAHSLSLARQQGLICHIYWPE
jgi:predicted Rossmann fold nucleotide-binding protein DprA/Smf involved in DNA uptake